VDLACSRAGGGTATLRFRYCIDANLKVRLLGTGVVDGVLVNVEVGRRRVSVTPPRLRPFVAKCVRGALPMLVAQLHRYVAGFGERGRLLDLSEWRTRTRPKRGKTFARK
jgi:hypothetical protein